MTNGRPRPHDAKGRVLRAATDRHGRRPLAWVAAPVLGAERVVDLCCADGALADEFAPGRWLGLEPGFGVGRPRLRATPVALPLRRSSVDGMALLLELPRLPRLDDVFAELRRVLQPGGTLVLLVPSAAPRSLAELRTGLAAVHCSGWANRTALDRAGWLLTAADFALLGDDRLTFRLPLPDAAAAHAWGLDLPAAGIWPPGAAGRHIGRLVGLAGPDRELPVPLRRLVARR